MRQIFLVCDLTEILNLHRAVYLGSYASLEMLKTPLEDGWHELITCFLTREGLEKGLEASVTFRNRP
jgi:hypothetical protein